jgi:hypothetical protein
MGPFAEGLDDSLERLLLDRWGWVVYRTSYKDEAAWDRLRNDMERWSRESLDDEAAPARVRSTVDWTFVSDAALDGASQDELRARFCEWRETAYLTETRRRPAIDDDDRTQRYMYFVEADEATLDSVAPGGGPAVVNFVRVDHDVPAAAPSKRPYGMAWPMLAKSVVGLEFWVNVLYSVEGGWDYDRSIDDAVMEGEEWLLETERERMEEERKGIAS